MADRRRAPWVTLPLAVSGLGLSSYLTWMHYRAPLGLSCPDDGLVDCARVTTSAQSMVAGVVPVAVLGVAFFAAMSLLCLPVAWQRGGEWVERLRVTGAVSGVLAVLYLVGVELLAVRAICLWCTAVHAVALALFVAVLAVGSGRAAVGCEPTEAIGRARGQVDHDEEVPAAWP